MRSNTPIFLFITIIIGIYILWPLNDFQSILAQGDHGRDLYAFQQTIKGKRPYQNYWWVYGPLMPYYYGIFFKLLSPTIKSILIAKNILILISCIFFYLSLSYITSKPISTIGTIWYLNFLTYTCTYNHYGGTAILLAITYSLLTYIHTNRKIYLHIITIILIFLLFLVKINFGFVALICSFFIFLLTDKFIFHKKTNKLIILLYLCIPFIVLCTYYLLLRGLPLYYIRQCMPYLPADHPYHASLTLSFLNLYNHIKNHITASITDIFLSILVICSTITSINILFNKKNKSYPYYKKEKILLTIITFLLFYICCLHEFLLSGVYYRLFWSIPFKYLLMFSMIGIMISCVSPILRLSLYIAFIILLYIPIHNRNIAIKKLKIPQQKICLKRAEIYVGNSHRWIDTVTKTTKYLQSILKSKETFFALPYEPLYYFLTDKYSPTREIIFFEHIKIPIQQEKKIIKQLERNKINFILISNRINSTEPGFGTFGKTYCPLLARYIQENFHTIAEFGDWQNPPGWAWNHGVRILKRNNKLY